MSAVDGVEKSMIPSYQIVMGDEMMSKRPPPPATPAMSGMLRDEGEITGVGAGAGETFDDAPAVKFVRCVQAHVSVVSVTLATVHPSDDHCLCISFQYRHVYSVMSCQSH